MATRRTELTRLAARLFAERGYHGTSIGDLAKALGVQKLSKGNVHEGIVAQLATEVKGLVAQICNDMERKNRHCRNHVQEAQ